MVIKIGFTGTREGMSTHQKFAIRQFLEINVKESKEDEMIEVHHGDCKGADADFHSICESFPEKIRIVIHPPSNPGYRAYCKGHEMFKEKEYLERNRDIVDMCDVLYACPKSGIPDPRSGTQYTINYARLKGKLVKLFITG